MNWGFHIILNNEYYDKIIPQSVAEFFQYFFVNCRTEGGYPIYDEMEINDLVICVVGHTRENEAHTQMFAYRKQEKDCSKKPLIGTGKIRKNLYPQEG